MGLESHNHPSAVDPFNGAATGVGGIIRDIISQGCKPIAILDCLRFGPPTTPRQRLLLDQVVLGISSYGNCVGIPNQGGDTEFAQEFTTNPLVNAMCVGVAHQEDIIRSIASVPGHKLLLFGSSSGRDGIGGVTFASEELDDAQQENRGSVQIGDPLTEKVLIDAIIELRDRKLLSGLQDLGGGGLVCAAVEMAEKGGLGVNLDLEQVPLREQNMKAWEILVSESQERMLAVVDPTNLSDVKRVLDKFDLNYAVVGEITEGNTFEGYHHDELQTELPVDFTINGFPEPKREVGEPLINSVSLVPRDGHPLEVLLSSFNLSSRQPIYQQYDQHVQGNTVIGAERDSGVILLPNEKYLVTAAGTNSYLVGVAPESGAALATLSIIRKVIVRGALPIGMVDSLNAGNPEKPSSYGEFVSMIRGVATVSHELDLPVVGGNVSLYNESEQNGKIYKILPSPFVGICGLIDTGEPIPDLLRDDTETTIYILGQRSGILKGSEYGRYYGSDDELKIDYDLERECMNFIIENNDQITSATPIGHGGLLGTLAKWAIQSEVGIELESEENKAVLYGENTPRYLLQLTTSQVDYLQQENTSISLHKIAVIRDDATFVADRSWSLEELDKIWSEPLRTAMQT